MREIKFRAWDTTNLKMYYQGYPTNLHSGRNEFFAGVLNGKPTIIYDYDFNGDTDNMTYSDDENFELMQYTGLKDKNGKEIYEGDIVLENNSHRRFATQIKWDFHEDHSGYKSQLGFNIWEDDEVEGCIQNLEVIGNIYENTELLK